jgi:REP element-mobilizing transposase RayT
MSDKYKIRDSSKAYFLTMTIVGWVDVFTRKNQKLAIVNSLDYCVKNKGLTIFAYVIMSNHIHLICRADGQIELADILRDFKKFTSKKIVKLIQEEPESRKEWMLEIFANACKHLKRNQNFKVWQDGNQAKEIYSTAFFFEKLEYIHNNPVKGLIVEKQEDYLFSSARNYADLDNYLEVLVEGHKPLVQNWK